MTCFRERVEVVYM